MTQAATSSTRIELEARLRQGSVEAKVRYESRNGVRTLKAEVERAQPGSVWPVFHNGVQVATVTVGALGRGEVEIRTQTDNPGQQGNVPVMAVGDSVRVGDATGTLRVK